jgi:hypothetical protein
MNSRKSLQAKPQIRAMKNSGLYLIMLFGLIVSLSLVGCGSENPFDRGPDFDDGTEIGPPGGGDEISFSVQVMPEIDICSSCHASGTGGWTYDGGADAFAQAIEIVDTDDPENSLMLIKGSGGDSHGGGTLFAVSSDEYDLILSWIEDGAPDN